MDEKLSEALFSPMRPFVFSSAASPASTTKTSPDESIPSPRKEVPDSPTPLRKPTTKDYMGHDSNVFGVLDVTKPNLEHSQGNVHLNPYSIPEPPTRGPSTINMEEGVIYNEKTQKYMKIIGRYQELLGKEIELPRVRMCPRQFEFYH
jgi:hypothetical protein